MKQFAVTEAAYLSGLVSRVQQHDNDAFAELYTLTYERLYASACSFLQDERLAQDALQETYIVVYQSIHTLREPKYFMAWLRSISQRICYDMRQKTRRQPSGMNEELLAVLPDDAQSPERSNQQQDLRDMVDRLPEKERQAVLLRYYAGLELKDVALAMGCSVSTVTRYLQRSHEKLRDAYGEGR